MSNFNLNEDLRASSAPTPGAQTGAFLAAGLVLAVAIALLVTMPPLAAVLVLLGAVALATVPALLSGVLLTVLGRL